ncbi:MAG: nicotinate-nucleotide--dimethylbenzimidazole phosphoribosyltransferase [Nitrospinaceae bacterium]
MSFGLAFDPTVRPVSGDSLQRARSHLDRLTKPPGSLGLLEDWMARFAAIHDPLPPRLEKKTVFVFAADHGVTAEGVSAYPPEVTWQMVLNFLQGGAAINVLARQAGAEVLVVDMGVNHEFPSSPGLIDHKVGPGTGNFLRETAMTPEQGRQAIETGYTLGRQWCGQGADILVAGDMGIGNTTAAAAILAVMGRKRAEEVTGSGTGLDQTALARKVDVIDRALQIHAPNPEDPLDVLVKVGGFEIGGIAGLILGAASRGRPVLVDGLISGAGAVLAAGLEPGVRDYLFMGHRSAEPGSQVILDRLGRRPLLDWGMRLGEGSGAVLALMMLEAGVRLYNEMATFGKAGVAEKGGGPEA